MRGMANLMFVFLLVGATACGSVPARQNADAGDDGGMPDVLGCMANSYSCGADNALYQCDAEGAALTKVQDCQYGCAADKCNECEADTTFCSNDELVMCSSSGTIENPQTCQYGCQMDRCNTCDPGVAYCDNSTAVTCGANGEPSAMMSCGAEGCSGGVCNTCQPNTTSCQGNTLVVCDANGTVASATSCALGCGLSPAPHCKALAPKYGVPAPSGTLPDLVVDANAIIDISECNDLDVTIRIGAVTSVVPTSQLALVSQSGEGAPICVVRFGSITIAAGMTLTVVNGESPGHALSLQTVGDVTVNGTIVFANAGVGPSRGVSASTVAEFQFMDNTIKQKAPGAGGAGGARAGGTGGKCIDCVGTTDFAGEAGGPPITTIATALSSGSRGGDVLRMGSQTSRIGQGGAGGGALHLVSLSRVAVGATGRMNLNGGGGTGNGKDFPAGGGGSGGSLVVEAPVVSVSAGAVVAANGGGGAGGCFNTTSGHANGQPGQLSATRAAGGDCPQQGDGGFEANGATTPSINGADSGPGGTTSSGGGGGGSSGFIVLRASSAATVMIAGGAVVSPTATIEAVTAN